MTECKIDMDRITQADTDIWNRFKQHRIDERDALELLIKYDPIYTEQEYRQNKRKITAYKWFFFFTVMGWILAAWFLESPNNLVAFLGLFLLQKIVTIPFQKWRNLRDVYERRAKLDQLTQRVDADAASDRLSNYTDRDDDDRTNN
jgi:hypothetical protein